MSETIRLALATESDLQGILHIYNQAILETTAVYTEQETTLAERRRWLKARQEAGFPVFVLSKGSEIAGFGTFGQFRPWPGYKYCAEHSLYIHTSFQRQGLGEFLLRKIILAAKEKNMHTLIAGIDAANKASIALHEKCGFESAGLLKEVGFKHHQWLDLQFMQKKL